MSIRQPFSTTELIVPLDEVIDELNKRVNIMISRWLVPSTVFTENTFFNWVMETMVSEELILRDVSFQMFMSTDMFKLVAEYSTPFPDVFELKIDSPEFHERFALLVSLTPLVMDRVKAFLHDAAMILVQRSTINATPPEAGLIAGTENVHLLPILYGSFQIVNASTKVWELETHSHENWLYNSVGTGILRLVLMHIRMYRTRILTIANAPETVGIMGAVLLTEQLAKQYRDVTMTGFVKDFKEIYGVSMDAGSQHLVNMLMDLFNCEQKFVTEVLFKPAFCPTSITGYVNVPFLIENILFAISNGTLNIPKMSFEEERRRARVRMWISQRDKLRRALVLAMENPNGISLWKLRQFSSQCNTSSRCFVHLTRAFNMLAEGIMMGQSNSRVELEAIEELLKHTPPSVLEELVNTRQEIAGPWKHAVTYADNGEPFVSLVKLVETMVHLVDHGTVSAHTWIGKSITIQPPPKRKSSFMQCDPGRPSLWRVLNSFCGIHHLAAKPKNIVVGSVSRKRLSQLAYGKHLPDVSNVIYNMCTNGFNDACSILPTFAITWNTCLTLRERLRAHCETNTTKRRCGKRQRSAITCCACFEDFTTAVTMECEHPLCISCASAMVEGRVRDAFIGKGSSKLAECPIPSCKGCMSDDTVSSLVPKEVYMLYLHCKKRRQSASGGHTCVVCGDDQPEGYCSETDGAVFTCSTCGSNTCTQCVRVAHPGFPCIRTQSGQKSPEDLLSAAKIQTCPTCKTPEVKRKNCNHLLCHVCKTDWCWACHSVLNSADTTTHYRDDSPACVLYNAQTEMARMKACLLKMTDENPETVRVAIRLLDDSLQQTEEDI